jgi:hypothetical protein
MIPIKEKCPLCNQEAEYTPEDFGRSKMYSCKKCEIFVIAIDLLDNLAGLPQKDREKLSKLSNGCTDENLLLISVEEGTKTFEGLCRPKNNWSL